MENSKNKIIDCFIFSNELELLYYRLSILYEVVDFFIIVESNYTHAGNKKELFYENNLYLFKKFSDKIIHVVIDLPFIYPNIDYTNNDQWKNECYQRNCINNGIQQLQLCDNDLITICDLDEIPSPKILIEFQQLSTIVDGFTLSLNMYYYNLNCKHKTNWDEKTKIVTFKHYKETTPQQIRNSVLPLFSNSGWHLSFFGDVKFIQHKISEFVHQEYNNNTYTDTSSLINKISNKIDIFDRSYVEINNIEIENNIFLPPKYNLYLNNYYKSNLIENNKNKIIIYFHICCINNWVEIVSKIFFKIKHSGLYNYVFEIRCVVLGDTGIEENKNIFNDSKIKIIYSSNDTSLYEHKTINLLYEDSKLDDFYVLYIHSKGVKHYKTEIETNVYDWSEYLSFFNIYNFEKCIQLLENYDAVGINLMYDTNNYPLHYSGNFWWSKTSHIKNNSMIIDNYWCSPEFWITKISGTYISLCNSNTHHYSSPYKFTNYENNVIDENSCLKIKF
jgi:beta-1,4-mannosyl-glycoprotein beta-1,4-N-acetylglucosaminyltransferase